MCAQAALFQRLLCCTYFEEQPASDAGQGEPTATCNELLKIKYNRILFMPSCTDTGGGGGNQSLSAKVLHTFLSFFAKSSVNELDIDCESSVFKFRVGLSSSNALLEWPRETTMPQLSNRTLNELIEPSQY